MKTNIIALFLLLFLAGCQNTVNTLENANKKTNPELIQDSRFITDNFLRDRLGLRSLIVSKTPDGRLKAQLEAVNLRTGAIAQGWSRAKKANPYKIRYKFTFFTEDGMAVEMPMVTGWREVTIIPGEIVYLQAIAPRRECVDFNVSLMEAK